MDTIGQLLDMQPNILLSYWYILNGKAWDCVEFANKNNIPVFLDSGAFTAMTSGGKINVQKYIDFCLKEMNRFEVIASLDVIMDWKNTEKNHNLMREAGIDSVPCFHVGEPFDFLERLCAQNDYIALGVAGNQKKRTSIMKWLIKCHSMAKGKKIHGFGMTGFSVMKYFDWYSVDSTTWHVGSRFGHILDERDLHQSKCQTNMTAKEMNLYNAKIMINWVWSLTKQKRNH